MILTATSETSRSTNKKQNKKTRLDNFPLTTEVEKILKKNASKSNIAIY